MVCKAVELGALLDEKGPNEGPNKKLLHDRLLLYDGFKKNELVIIFSCNVDNICELFGER